MYVFLNKKGFYKLVQVEFVCGKKVKHYIDLTEQQAMVYINQIGCKLYKEGNNDIK